jgi:hypothetical protein
VTISTVAERAMVATVTCLAASPASLVAMKLQSAPRRSLARADRAANDYADLYRLLSNAELLPEIAHDLAVSAPHDLGPWAVGQQIRTHSRSGPMRRRVPIRRSGLAEQPSATEVEATAAGVLGGSQPSPHRAPERGRMWYSPGSVEGFAWLNSG